MVRQEPQASHNDGSETFSAWGAKTGGSAIKRVPKNPSEQAWGLAKSSASVEGTFTTQAGQQKPACPFPSGISAPQTPAPSSSSGILALMKLYQAGGTRKQCFVAMAT